MKASPTQTNLVLEQRSLLKKIYSQGENLWKVVIFDNFNREINSALFKMKDLRENNITLYFHIKDAREQLHGVTAIYLVQPNKENLDLIYQDFEEDLYSSVILHFSGEPQGHIISTLAKNLSQNKPAALTKMAKVEYSCLGFHTVGRNLAVMENNNEIINLLSALKHRPVFIHSAKEEQQVSFIRERLAESLVFGKEPDLVSFKQPHNLVFFYNREADYFPVLHHAITYAGLIESIYRLSANGQKILRPNLPPIDLDLNDDIWTERRNLPISELALSEELNLIKVKLMNEKQKLNAVNEHNERQKKIELHMTIASDLLKEASARKLNQYYECEMQVYRKRVLTSELKKDIRFLLETTDHEQDKVRLLLIVLLYCEHISSSEIEEFEQKVPALKRSKLYAETKAKRAREASEGQSGMVGGAGKMLKKFSIGLLSNFKSGDKFLAAKCVQKLGGLKEAELRELGLSMSSLGTVPAEVKVSNIIVYCTGGGCLSEQANLSKFDQRVIYACDRMLNSSELTN